MCLLCRMYYRRKIALAVIQAFGGDLDKVSFQKLLFLFTRQQVEKSYHFVPYKFGCYSFQANADLSTLTKYGHVDDSGESWKCIDGMDYANALKSADRLALKTVVNRYDGLAKDDLIKLTYMNYPYYTINSTIAATVLSVEDLALVEEQKNHLSEIILFTIGYEGVTLEEYVNKLITNGVNVLCDVRRSPFSMKYGFNKGMLQKVCAGVGIDYVHIPEVGIDSDKRKVLHTQADYDKLFEFYRSEILTNQGEKQEEILHLLTTKKRVALTCFEANICQCHRKHLAESVAKLPNFHYKVQHI